MKQNCSILGTMDQWDRRTEHMQIKHLTHHKAYCSVLCGTDSIHLGVMIKWDWFIFRFTASLWIVCISCISIAGSLWIFCWDGFILDSLLDYSSGRLVICFLFPRSLSSWYTAKLLASETFSWSEYLHYLSFGSRETRGPGEDICITKADDPATIPECCESATVVA